MRYSIVKRVEGIYVEGKRGIDGKEKTEEINGGARTSITVRETVNSRVIFSRRFPATALILHRSRRPTKSKSSNNYSLGSTNFKIVIQNK